MARLTSAETSIASLNQTLGGSDSVFGLIFQATDDLLDFTGQKNILGKTAQKDLKKNKGTISTAPIHIRINAQAKKPAKPINK